MKLNRSRIFLALLGFGLSAFLSVVELPSARAVEIPQEAAPQVAVSERKAGLGFAAGTLSGVGIAYRSHWADGGGIGITGIAWGNAELIFADVGVNYLSTLSHKGSIRFYLVGGGAVFLTSMATVLPSDGSECAGDCGPGERIQVHQLDLNLGGGIGMEFEIVKDLGLAIELPLSLMVRATNDPYQARYGLVGVFPVPSAALIYYF